MVVLSLLTPSTLAISAFEIAFSPETQLRQEMAEPCLLAPQGRSFMMIKIQPTAHLAKL